MHWQADVPDWVSSAAILDLSVVYLQVITPSFLCKWLNKKKKKFETEWVGNDLKPSGPKIYFCNG